MTVGRLAFRTTPLAGLMLVERQAIEDNRGFLSRFYCSDEFDSIGIHKPIAQINHTRTRIRGAVRGLHFQRPPHAETKIVSCIRGEVWDVAVDIRRNSPTYLQWYGEVLSESNRRSLLIPEGFAHGFQTLSENCELIYLHTAAYQPESEGALNVADPELGIAWPLAVTELSERDRKHRLIGQEFEGIDL